MRLRRSGDRRARARARAGRVTAAPVGHRPPDRFAAVERLDTVFACTQHSLASMRPPHAGTQRQDGRLLHRGRFTGRRSIRRRRRRATQARTPLVQLHGRGRGGGDGGGGGRRGAIFLQRTAEVVDAAEQRGELLLAQLQRRDRRDRGASYRVAKACASAAAVARTSTVAAVAALSCSSAAMSCFIAVMAASVSARLGYVRHCFLNTCATHAGTHVRRSAATVVRVRTRRRASYSSLCLRSVRAPSSSALRLSMSVSACGGGRVADNRHTRARRSSAARRAPAPSASPAAQEAPCSSAARARLRRSPSPPARAAHAAGGARISGARGARAAPRRR